MSDFHYTTFPQEIYFGADALTQLPALIAQKNWTRLLLVTTGSQRRNGNLARIETLLGEKLVATFDRTQPHVPQSNVEDATQLARAHSIDALIALGGGSSIGVAKATSHNLQSLISNLQLSILAIPTTYAGSEMTPVFGVTRERDGVTKKETVNNIQIVPRVVLYDPVLTLDVPRDLTASTGINALAHCVEAVYSITKNPISTLLALEGSRLMFDALPRCVENGSNLAARTDMLQGTYFAGAALANVTMGLHHGVCHVLGGTANVPHGIANAIVLPHAIRFNADTCAPELAQIAETMGIPRHDQYAMAMDAALRVKELVEQMNLPTRLRDVGITENDLGKLAELAFQNRTVQNNPKKINNLETMRDFMQSMF